MQDSVKHKRGIRKTSAVDQKIPLKSSLLTLSEPYSLSKKVPDRRDFRETFPTEMKSSRRRRMSNKRNEEIKLEKKKKLGRRESER